MSDTEKLERRGRPRSFDVERALDQAMRLFHASGYEGVGIAELTAALGISPPSLYAAFGSKRDLYERALQRYANSIGVKLVAELATPGPAAEAIGRFLARAVELYTADPKTRGCLVLEGARNVADPAVCRMTAERKAVTYRVLRDRIAVERPDLAKDVADFVMTVVAGLSAAARDGVTRARLRAVAARAAAAVASELGARSATSSARD